MWLVIEAPDGARPAAVDLRDGTLLVGRGVDCQLSLDDPAASRRHVALTTDGASVTFEDQGSRTGTLLNGAKTPSGPLAPGDRLVVGRTTLRLVPERPDEGLALSPAAAAPAIDWRAFRDFLEPLQRAGKPRELLERLLRGLVGLLRAHRGYVLLREGSGMTPVASWRLPQGEDLVAVSSTIARKALETRRLVHVANSREDERCAGARSLADSAWPTTIYCAPLLAGDEPLGVLYLDMPFTAVPRDAGEGALLESVTGLAAQLVSASRVRDALLAERGRLQELRLRAGEEEAMVAGEGPASAALERLLASAAPQDVTVLLTGETGTGKEMVARELHRRSPRADGPFIPVNCAAIPRDLVEAELFGVEKGAFTGADERRAGRFELAAGGTLFLDEIGELPPEVQVKLLRVLQERSVARVGGRDPVALDFRLVCATNRDLEASVREGAFRQDLYYRINVFRVALLPLRERPGDILPLASRFLAQACARFGRKLLGFTPEAERLLTTHPWKGNVRELRNAVERAAVVETGPRVAPESLPVRTEGAAPGAKAADFWSVLPLDWDAARETFERAFLERSLARHKGNVSSVAKETSMPRSTIYRRLRAWGLVGEE